MPTNVNERQKQSIDRPGSYPDLKCMFYEEEEAVSCVSN